MTKYHLILKLFLGIFLVASLTAYNTGSPGGKTNAPNEGSCGEAGCHSVSGVDKELIFADIPSTGYVPGNTYTIEVTNTAPAFNKFGFELAAYNKNGTLINGLSGNDSVTAFSSNRRATHKLGKTGGVGSKTWKFQWTAPSQGARDVTFYVSSIAANGNNQPTFDNLFVDELKVKEEGALGFSELAIEKLTLYPNPAINSIHLKSAEGQWEEFSIYSISGELKKQGKFASTISILELNAGEYILKIKGSKSSVTKRFTKI